jgi:hypothetical protein
MRWEMDRFGHDRNVVTARMNLDVKEAIYVRRLDWRHDGCGWSDRPGPGAARSAAFDFAAPNVNRPMPIPPDGPAGRAPLTWRWSLTFGGGSGGGGQAGDAQWFEDRSERFLRGGFADHVAAAPDRSDNSFGSGASEFFSQFAYKNVNDFNLRFIHPAV